MKNNLRFLMLEQSLSITKLSKEIGISRNTLTKIYYEKNDFSISTLLTLCDFFGCTPNEFLGKGKHFESESI